MRESRGRLFGTLCACLILCGFLLPDGLACAQATANDVAARQHFERGRVAFEAADYERALVQFRQAYGLSSRARLLYNIGITASRLRRDEEALVAFERYLAEMEEPPREQEVRERIAALRASIAHDQAERERAIAEAAMHRRTPSSGDQLSGRRVPKSAIVGSSVLAVIGAAGVITMGVGFARSGSCVERDSSGQCVAERSTSPWNIAYGAVGVAALAGSATWLGVSSKRTREKRSTAVTLAPMGVVVSGSF